MLLLLNPFSVIWTTQTPVRSVWIKQNNFCWTRKTAMFCGIWIGWSQWEILMLFRWPVDSCSVLASTCSFRPLTIVTSPPPFCSVSTPGPPTSTAGEFVLCAACSFISQTLYTHWFLGSQRIYFDWAWKMWEIVQHEVRMHSVYRTLCLINSSPLPIASHRLTCVPLTVAFLLSTDGTQNLWTPKENVINVRRRLLFPFADH